MAKPRISPAMWFLLAGLTAGGAGVGSGWAEDSRTPDQNPFREYVTVTGRAYQRIGLTVTVMDRAGKPVHGLTRDDFLLFEDKKPTKIVEFGVEGKLVDRPLSVAVLLDISESMVSEIEKVRQAGAALLSVLRPRDEILVAQFNQERTVLQPFTSNPELPQLSPEGLRAWGGTLIFDAIEETLKDLRDRKGRKVILVVTDGIDNTLSWNGAALQDNQVRDILHLCLRTETVVYGVRPGMKPGVLAFETFVEESGGRLLFTGKDLVETFRGLGEEFLSQYYLGYDIDPGLKEGKRRRVRVATANPELKVFARSGYVTPRSNLETRLKDLVDPDSRMRADAAYELGFFRDLQVVRPLQRALKDKNAEVRRLAIVSLSRLDVREAIPRWVDLLGDESASVRETAAQALISAGAPAVDPLLEAMEKGGNSEKKKRRMATAARILGRVGGEKAYSALRAMLKGDSWQARSAAAEALGELGLVRSISELTPALKDESPVVRAAALRSLLKIAGGEVRPLVEELLAHEKNPEVQKVAREALKSR